MRAQPRVDSTISLSDGRTIAYAEWGDAGGVPALYFHGWPGSRLEGSLLDASAKRHHIRLITIDRPGYGGSTFRPSRTIEGWTDDVAEIAAGLGVERFAVMGLSGGAPYALACALKLSERLIATLVISGEPPQITKRAPWYRKAIAWWTHRTRFVSRGYFAFVAWSVRRNPKRAMRWAARSIVLSRRDRELWKDEELREGFAADLREAFRQGTRCIDEDLRLYTQRWGFDLEDVRAPVHWWHGEDDRIVPIAHARREIVALPNVKATYYAGEGHFLIIEHLDEILGALVRA
jgi:pimeloyl-ACP methyl ester carboxylesterase